MTTPLEQPQVELNMNEVTVRIDDDTIRIGDKEEDVARSNSKAIHLDEIPHAPFSDQAVESLRNNSDFYISRAVEAFNKPIEVYLQENIATLGDVEVRAGAYVYSRLQNRILLLLRRKRTPHGVEDPLDGKWEPPANILFEPRCQSLLHEVVLQVWHQA